MKTLQEIQNEYSIENGLDNWPELVEYYIYWDNAKLLFHIEEVAKRFAIEVAKEALNNASKNAFMKWHCGQYKTDTPTQYHQSGSDNIQIDKSSILHEYNIPKL